MSTELLSTEPLRVAVIVGSTREGRRGRVIADWLVRELAERTDLTIDLLDLAEIELPHAMPGQPDARLPPFQARIERADAFVVVTPEYNHSYPASLKHAIDLAHAEWKRKPVAFVSYGGVSGGLRAVEHLRGVFAELHATTVRESVSFHGAWNGFGDRDHPADPVSARQAVTVMADDLVWWGRTLRAGRSLELVDANW
jgi:NAD(P)H-dependent FMN reductase